MQRFLKRFLISKYASAPGRSLSRRRLLQGIAAGAAVITAGEDAVKARGEAQVPLCHASGNGSYRIVSVASTALPAHMAHGDFEPFACNGELSCFPSLPLFCNSAEVCPTEATEFCPGGPLDPTSRTQAKAACEACFGQGACVHNDLDCSGAGWLESFAPQSEPDIGVPVFGYETGLCNPANPQPPGRVYTAIASDPTTDYGFWGTGICPE